MPGDVAHDQQHIVVREQQRVIPVTADQVALAGWPVADRDVYSGGLHGRRVRRHDGLLQPHRQQMLLRELVTGGGQGDLSVVVGRDVLEGAAQCDHAAGRVDHRFGEDPYLPDAPVVGVDDAEGGGRGFPAFQQALPESLHLGPVGRHHVAGQIRERDFRSGPRREAEQAERRIGPAHRAGDEVFLPSAQAPDPLRVIEEHGPGRNPRDAR